MPSIDRWTHTRELRTCKTCGHKRKVKVTREHYVDGTHKDSWSLYCSACEDDQRSRYYARMSTEFAKRAVEKHSRNRRRVITAA